MPYRIVLDMDDDVVALVTKKHTESRMLPSLWKAVSVSEATLLVTEYNNMT